MITLASLARLADRHRDDLAAPVRPVSFGGRTWDTDQAPVLMGVVNLSRDSTYRDSVAISTASAVRRARIMAAQGASLIDVGAESSTLRAQRVGDAEQIAALVPVVEQLAQDGIAVSVESYSTPVVRACLRAGAAVVNLTGATELPALYEAVAEHAAAVVMCFVPGANVREVADVDLAGDPMPGLLDYFGARLEHAAGLGVTSVMIDPGLGFYYGNLTDPLVRARHQARVLLQSFRLRRLGAPICQAMPHAFDLFEEEFRTAEGFFAALSMLGGVGVFRTHEVARVAAVLRAMELLEA